MGRLTALLDASVLFAAPIRDLLIELAVGDAYRAVWTARIHEEWIRAVLRARPALTRARLERTRTLMDAHVRDALVTGYEHLIERLSLPDADDRHVLAAAIAARASTIVTANLKDFPDAELDPHGIRVATPDEFLAELFRSDPSRFLAAARTVRMRLRQPPVSAPSYLDILASQGLRQTVGLLQPYQRYL